AIHEVTRSHEVDHRAVRQWQRLEITTAPGVVNKTISVKAIGVATRNQNMTVVQNATRDAPRRERKSSATAPTSFSDGVNETAIQILERIIGRTWTGAAENIDVFF